MLTLFHQVGNDCRRFTGCDNLNLFVRFKFKKMFVAGYNQMGIVCDSQRKKIVGRVAQGNFTPTLPQIHT